MTELKCPKCGETEAIYYYFAEKCGIKCGNTNCGYEIKDCESVEEAEFKWKSKNNPKALRSCPFCGSDDVHIRFFHGMRTVECYGCLVKVIQMEDDEPERFWNRRVNE